MAEFSAVIRKDVAWRVIVKATMAIIGGSITIFVALIGPVLWVYGNIDGNRRDNLRLQDEVKGLNRTVGELQITVAGAVSEGRASRSEQTRDLADIKLLLQQQQRRPPVLDNAASSPPIRRTK